MFVWDQKCTATHVQQQERPVIETCCYCDNDLLILHLAWLCTALEWCAQSLEGERPNTCMPFSSLFGVENSWEPKKHQCLEKMLQTSTADNTAFMSLQATNNKKQQGCKNKQVLLWLRWTMAGWCSVLSTVTCVSYDLWSCSCGLGSYALDCGCAFLCCNCFCLYSSCAASYCDQQCYCDSFSCASPALALHE